MLRFLRTQTFDWLHTDYTLWNGSSSRAELLFLARRVLSLLAETSATSFFRCCPTCLILLLLPCLLEAARLFCLFLLPFGRPRFFFVVAAARDVGEAVPEATREAAPDVVREVVRQVVREVVRDGEMPRLSS